MGMGLAAVALAAALVACSDDNDTSRGEAREARGSPVKAELRAYCVKVLDVETVPFPQVGEQPDAERAATFTEYASRLRALVDEVVAVAPARTKADHAVVARALGEVVKAGGDLTKRATPEVRAAAARTHAFDLASCGWSQVNTAGLEYAFERFPESVPSGVVSFELVGKGDEAHVLELYRVNDDVTASGRQIFGGGVPSKEDLAQVTDLGAAFAQPGDRGYVVRDLQPGRYVAACLISLGTEPLTTHATKGMLAEFEVT